MPNKLTDAQGLMLSRAPQDWSKVPVFGDMRPYGPLLRKGMIEERKIDVTPQDWGSGPIKVVRQEWRITDAGRLALSDSKENGE